MYISLHLGQLRVLVCVNIVEYYSRTEAKKKSNFMDDDYRFSSSVTAKLLSPILKSPELPDLDFGSFEISSTCLAAIPL